MRTMNPDMDQTPHTTIETPSDEVLAQAMMERVLEHHRARLVAAELAPRVEQALGVRRRGTS
jgi:hypothetical protein